MTWVPIRGRDDLADQVQNVFKRFLEEYAASPYEEDTLNGSSRMETEEDLRDDVTNATNDSFSSARSRPQQAYKRSGGQVLSKYAKDALLLLTNERNTLFIDYKDIELFDSNLAEDIILDYYRFYPYLCRAVAAYVREEKIRQTEAAIDPNAGVSERMLEREHIKKELDRPQVKNKNYYVGFYNFAERDNIRDLSSTKIGTLTRVTGQVVRTHSVHPELIIGCFKCKDCLSEQYVEQQFRYTLPAKCSNENCNNRTRYDILLDRSRFTDFQRLRIQETQQELPRGCIPRCFDVIVRGSDQVECIQPGDQCDFVGTLIAVPDLGQMMNGAFGTVSSEVSGESGVSGLKSLGVKEMIHSLAFLANACIIDGHEKPSVNTDPSHSEATIGSKLDVADFSNEEIMRIEKMSHDHNLLDNLSQSLFSSIHGSEDVKRGIILQLLGGCPKQTSTGTKLRGDINICLVGDPSTAKSQFLKIVTDFAPVKAVYASGKASSASGLTAAVVRDADDGFVIEAGALMLADRGICCIDEFDKMDLKDQVAIHEAMEQQTISITKAGVTATLNARASILAAANPIGGTYDTKRDLRSNVNFSLPIMSRFDLFFTLIDAHEETNDYAIATKIVDMHLNYANSTNTRRPDMVYSFEDIRLYLRFARKYFPTIPAEAEEVFVQEYLRLRTSSILNRKAWRITVRQLESLVRLSEAIARAHCDITVKPEYIRLASRLIEKTNVTVGNTEVDLNYVPNQEVPNVGGDQPSQGLYEGELESQRLEPSQPASAKETLDLASYKNMAMIFVKELRKREEMGADSMRKIELIDWYLRRCLGEIASREELAKRKQICEKVIRLLVRKDHVLMELREDGGLVDPAAPEDESDREGLERRIIVNPEIVDVEDFFTEIIA